MPPRHQTEAFSWLEGGEGEPVLFLHPVIATAEFWLPQLRAFASSRRCLALDAPGYDGRISKPLDPTDLGHRIAAFLDEREIDRVDVVGLSLGGMHAMYAMHVDPQRIGRVVLADTSPAFGIDPDAWLADWLAPLNVGTTPAELVEASLDSIVHAPIPPAVRAPVIEAAQKITEGGLRAASSTIAAHDMRGRLPTMEHEVLVVVGEHDGETPPEYSVALAETLPNARLAVVPDAGHLSSLEQPDTFNALLEKFLVS